MPKIPDTEIAAQPSRDEPNAVDLARRKLGVGLGVSAVFTLASRPVLAGQCMSASSAASGNLSTHGTPPTCTGLTPAQWVALADGSTSSPNSPNNGYPPGTNGNVKFHSVFASGSSANWGADARLYEVMGGTHGGSSARGGVLGSPSGSNLTPSSANPISAEFSATLLNIRDSRIPTNVLSETTLIGMWNEWLTTGMYSPMAGASWSTDQIVAYLRTLQGA